MKLSSHTQPAFTPYLLLLALICTQFYTVLAQGRPSDNLFKQLSHEQGITSLTLSKNIIQLIDVDFNNEDQDSIKVSGPLKEVRMTICSKEEAPGWSEKISAFMQNRPFKEVEIDESDDPCRLYIHRKRKKILACHVVFDGEESLVMLSFFGHFQTKDLNAISQKAKEIR